MKKILLLLLLSLLSGCVTYYTPEAAVEDGVYYAQDDLSYINNAYAGSSYRYAGAAYYPWWSMDYFYLGYRPYGYQPYRYPDYRYAGYGAYAGGGFSIGISYGYSPWFYPDYGYYSPWYRPYRYYGHHRGYRHGRRSHDNDAGGGHERFSGNGHNNPTDRSNRGGDDEDGNEDPGDRRNRNRTGSYDTSPVRRYVSTAPSGHSGNQGMVIRSRETTKIGKSRVDPVKTDPIAVTDLTSSTVRVTQSVYRSRQDGREIRYRSSPKQGRARTDPVRSASSHRGISSAVASSGTAAVPVQRSVNIRQVQAGTTRHASGKSRSEVSSRSPSRSRSNSSVSHSSRSYPSSSSSRGSSHSRSGHSRRQN